MGVSKAFFAWLLRMRVDNRYGRYQKRLKNICVVVKLINKWLTRFQIAINGNRLRDLIETLEGNNLVGENKLFISVNSEQTCIWHFSLRNMCMTTMNIDVGDGSVTPRFLIFTEISGANLLGLDVIRI